MSYYCDICGIVPLLDHVWNALENQEGFGLKVQELWIGVSIGVMSFWTRSSLQTYVAQMVAWVCERGICIMDVRTCVVYSTWQPLILWVSHACEDFVDYDGC